MPCQNWCCATLGHELFVFCSNDTPRCCLDVYNTSQVFQSLSAIAALGAGRWKADVDYKRTVRLPDIPRLADYLYLEVGFIYTAI